MRVTAFSAEGARPASAADLPGLLRAPGTTVWVDITGPDADGLRVLHDVFAFHPLAIEDTRNQEQRPKIEEYEGYLFVTLNAASGGDGRIEFRELDVFLGPNYLVSVHRGREPSIEDAERRVGMGSGPSAGYLLYVLVDVVVDGYFPLLDRIDEEIDDVEDQVLGEPDQRLLNRLFQLKRALLEVRRVVGPQRDMFNVLTRRDLPYVDQTVLGYHLRDVYDHLLRITDIVDNFRDMLTSTVDLYMSAVSNKLNRVVNRLTAITLVIGVLAVITGFYGMNFERTWPPFAAGWGVPSTLIVMAAVVAGLFALFRRLRWL